MFEHDVQYRFDGAIPDPNNWSCPDALRLEILIKKLEERINCIEDGLQSSRKDECFVLINLSELRKTLEDSMRNLEALERRLKR